MSLQCLERNTDLAILKGNTEILSSLLDKGARVGLVLDETYERTTLNCLLRKPDKSRETKLQVVRILIDHLVATRHDQTMMFLDSTLEHACYEGLIEDCEILLHRGVMLPHKSRAFYIAIRARNVPLIRLLVRHGGDPFFVDKARGRKTEHDGCNNKRQHRAASPFLAAARQKETTVFRVLLELWNTRYARSTTGGGGGGGMDANGNFPIHILLRDKHVSVQAVKILMNEFKANVSQRDGCAGLLPFHLAAMADASWMFCILCSNSIRGLCWSRFSSQVIYRRDGDGRRRRKCPTTSTRYTMLV